jgi:hypothetical protein
VKALSESSRESGRGERKIEENHAVTNVNIGVFRALWGGFRAHSDF